MTARRRAGETGSALRRGMAAVPAVPVELAREQSSHAVGVKSAEAKLKRSKYTVLLDGDTAAAFDELALMARRSLGRRVDKSELLCVLVLLASDDASLREQVIGEVARRAE